MAAGVGAECGVDGFEQGIAIERLLDTACAPVFQLVRMPSRDELMIASVEPSTMAASCSASSKRPCSAPMALVSASGAPAPEAPHSS